MKLFKKVLLAILVSLVVVSTSQILIPELPTSSVVEAASVKISKTKYTMNKGEKYTLKIKGTKKKVKWSTSNKKIATVNSKGKVTAKKKGKVTITGKVGGKKYKCKVKVETPKINAKSKKIAVTESCQLKISGTSQKIKWSSNNKNVVTVNSKGKVTAIGVGSATVSAKVGKTNYKCTFTVVAYPFEKNISVSFKRTSTSVIGFFTNRNSVPVSINPQIAFYDANGGLQSTSADFNYCLGSGRTTTLEFLSYNSSTYKSQTFSSFKLNMRAVQKSYYTSYANNIKVKASETDGAIMAEVTNTSGKNLDTINLSIVYYDANGNIIDYTEQYADCKANGSTDYMTFNFPYDSTYTNKIIPARYEIYVNHAYQYN